MSDDAFGYLKLVKASAGTGKTYGLTGHYLQLLEPERGAAPGEILATTFTRKAAGEIFARVMMRLVEQAAGKDGAAPDGPARQRLLELCTQLDRVAISTLDSFFQRIGSAFRFELDVPPEPTVVDDDSPVATELRHRAIGELLTEGVGGEDRFKALLDLLERLHHGAAKSSVRDAIDRIVKTHAEVFRRAPEEVAWTALEVPEAPTDSELEGAIERVPRLKQSIPRGGKDGKGKPDGRWEKQLSKEIERLRNEDWDALFSGGFASKMLNKVPGYYGKDFPAEWVVVFGPICRKIRAELLGRIARQTHATWELMRDFTARYDALRRERGVLLYSDIPLRLADLVAPRGDAEARAAKQDLLLEIQYRMDAKVQHLLLDEFQDTSTQQWRVLEGFASEITAQGARSLYVVGDAKQAIYGWRGGEAALFDAVEALMRKNSEGANPIRNLDKSYRSSPVITGFVNQVFNNLLAQPAWGGTANGGDADDPDRPGAEAFCRWFEDHVAEKTEMPGFVTLESSPEPEDGQAEEDDGNADDADADNGSGAEAEKTTATAAHVKFVAERIEAIHAEHPGATIGVLAGTNAAVNRILLALQNRGLPASGEGGNTIATHPAVAYLMAVLVAADHPGDDAAWFQVAGGPLASRLGLEAWRGACAKQRRVGAAAAAQKVRAALVERGYADVLAQWAALTGPATDAVGRGKLAHLMRLAGEFDAQYPPGDLLRPRRLVSFIEASKVEEPTESPIRVMTVHKSKGLEFDAVVLPELDRAMKLQLDVLVDRVGPLDPVAAVYRAPNKEVAALSDTLAQARQREVDRRREEDLCAFYVSLTRAKRALYLLVKPGYKALNSNKTKPAVTHARALRELLGDPDEGPIVVADLDCTPDWSVSLTAPDTVTPVEFRDPRPSFARGQTPTRMRPAVAPSGLNDRFANVSGAALLSGTPTAGQRYGTRLHEELCEVEYVGAFDMSDASDGLKRALLHDAVRKALSPRFDREAPPWRERAFSVIDGGRRLRGSVDRVAIGLDDDGKPEAAHVIDFKTDAVDAGDTTTIELKAKGYQAQMDAYRSAVAMQLGLSPDKVTAELLFVGAGVSVAV